VSPLRLVSLKSLCQAQGTPYYELCYDDSFWVAVNRGITLEGVRQIATPYVYCGMAQDVNIFSTTFIHTSADEYVFHGQSSQNSPKRAGFKQTAEAFIELRRESLFQSYIDEECIFFGGLWGDVESPTRIVPARNFGHFIFEFLTRMPIFEMLGLTQRLPLAVYEEVPEAWLGFIELAGGSRDRMIRVPAVRAQAYRKVWVASSTTYRDHAETYRFWGAGLHWLRFKVLHAIGGPKLAARRRIFIGRDGAPTRRLINEPDVVALLARYGIEQVSMSALSAREQVETVSGAELIVAVLGAGTLLSYFAPEHCAHIILAPRGVGAGLWGGAGAATFFRQPYERLECDPVAGGSDSRLNIYGHDELADFKVDLTELQKLVEAALRLNESTQARDVMKI